MSCPHAKLRSQLAGLAVVLLVLVWVTAFYEINRSKQSALHEAEVRTAAQAHVFAEFALSSIKRINELLIDLRFHWDDNWTQFAAHVQRRQDTLSDIAFQVAIIDSNGILAFSNLAPANTRIDLSDRKHFRIHADMPSADQLFISEPIKGKVSGKWSIQFSRPVFRGGIFDGVLVASVDPKLFSDFSSQLYTDGKGMLAVVRQSGQVMARHPAVEAVYGQPAPESILRAASAEVSGNVRGLAPIDGIPRIYGYYKLPDYGLSFFVGESMDEVLAPFYGYRTMITGTAVVVSMLVIFFCLQLNRSLGQQQAIRIELQAAKEQAETASQAKSRFLATMSHEIRTPMNGVIGMAQLSASDPTLSPRQRDNMEILVRSADSLLAIIDDILDFSKIEAGKLRIEAIDFSLFELMTELTRLYAPLASQKQIELLHRMSPAVPACVSGDPTRLRQILNNFLSNAFKFTPAGRITLNVENIDSRSTDSGSLCSRVRFTVADTGIGIAADFRSQIFMPFTQADSSTTRGYGGTGLGLSISRQLAELMGGSVGVTSELGKGSAFWVEIPFSSSHIATPAPHTVVTEPAAVVDRRAWRILVVDDHHLNQLVSRQLLRQVGYEDVFVVENGAEAIEAVDRERFDFVLMDCQMPVMDGIEATKILRAKGFTMPIIAMTAHATQENRDDCFAAGMNDFLSKPLLIGTLRTAIENAAAAQLRT